MEEPKSVEASESFRDSSGTPSMTDPKGRPIDVEGPSQFAPKYPAKFASALSDDDNVWIDAEDLLLGGVPRERSPTVQNLAFPRSLDPSTVPEPPQLSRPRRLVRLVALLVMASVVAGAFVVIWGRDNKPPPGGDEADKSSLVTRLSALVAGESRQPITESAPHLVVTRVPGDLHRDEATTLGVAVDGAASGAQVVVGGVAAGSVFSAGRSIGTAAWSLPAWQIETATLMPPRSFVGVMDVAITLMQANGNLTDRKVVHLQWVPETSSLQVPEPTISRRLDPSELNALVARANALVATGDLSGARLLYRRAAEAGNARAALTLAETYDPDVLATLGESGLAPNVGMARAWYKKAKELGSADATARLERLERRSE
jgi:hypothetical protein